MIEQELGARLAEAIFVKINLVSNLAKDEGIHGDCTWTDNNRNPREFEIRIDVDQTPYIRMRTLSHEIIHLRQYAKNQLFDYVKFGFSRFNGVRVNFSNMNELEQPWEVEADSKEIQLLLYWVEATESHHLIKKRHDNKSRCNLGNVEKKCDVRRNRRRVEKT